MANMTKEQAGKVYDVLVEECGAASDGFDRAQFVYHQAESDERCAEYRFIGRLGMGGKFWVNPSLNRPAWYVNCYQEHETPERRQMIEQANKRLAELEARG